MKKKPIIFILIVMMLAVVSACAQSTRRETPAPAASSDQDCRPIETRSPNASEQKPSFSGQTRACGVKTATALEVAVVAKGLANPWGFEPLPNGDFLVTEKSGQMRIVTAAGEIGPPIGGLLPVGQGGVSDLSSQGGLPPISARGQGGLLDVALSPDFKRDRIVFWSFAEQRQDGSGTSVARGKLTEDQRNLEDVRVIFRALPSYNNGLHFGSRLAFGPDGMLYITLGDRFDRPNRLKVQQFDNHLGKVIRIKPDGSVPADNPFAGQAGALPEIWDLGHRNVQSAVFDERGGLWTVEHGARGGDELNLVEKGKNYGWSVVTFGQEYSGDPIPGAVTEKDGFESPVYYWDPVIAPSGAEVYTGKLFPEWKGNIFIGGLASRRLVRLVLKDNRVTGEEHLLTDRNQRIRDVRQGLDGALYVITDEGNGELLRITPKK